MTEPQDTGTLAKMLANAQSEDAVTGLLEQLEHNENCKWVPIGTEQNYSIVFSNSSDPVAAFAELIVNSFDAVLMKRYRECFGDEYNPETGLITVEDAVNVLFDDPDNIDETIKVIADGDAEEPPNLIVRDSGTGQPREKFVERFMNIASGSQFKDDWPFTQGRFKMGSAAVLPHSGKENYKFIASAAVEEPGVWSWSIIRDNSHDGLFEYLLIDGDIGRFEGELLEQEYGTVTKVYNYQNIGYGHITAQYSLRAKLERVLVKPAIPFHMVETRKENSRVNEQDVHGLFGRLEHWNVEPVVKMDKYIRHDFGEPFGERKVRVVVFHPNDVIADNDDMSKRSKDAFVSEERHLKQAVMYLVNGQAHSYERRSFLTGSRSCQYKHTGKDMIVFMDLSDFGDKQHHDRRDFLDLFRPSRDTMGGTELAEQLRSELVTALKDDAALQDEEEWRRNRLTRSKRNELDVDIIESMLEQSPAMRRYFQTGERVQATATTSATTDGGEYSAPFYPTKLNIIENKHRDGSLELWDEANGIFTKSQPVNQTSQIQFELDAPNDYFDRKASQGVLNIDGVQPASWGLHNGILTVRLEPLSGVSPGDKQRVVATVTRKFADPLRRVFDIEYTEREEQRVGKGDMPENEPRMEDYDPPAVTEVYQPSEDVEDGATWDDMSPTWTESDIAEITRYGDEYDIYVNMDAAPLHHYVQSHNLSDAGKGYVQKVWKMGIMFYALSQYVELDEEGVDPDSIVPVTMRGTAQSMLNQHIGEDELKRITA